MSIARVSWPKQIFSFLVVFFFLQQFHHECLIHAVSSEQLMLRSVCYLNSVKHLFGLLSEVQLTNELILFSRGNFGSSFPVLVLMRASAVIVLDGFCVCI